MANKPTQQAEQKSKDTARTFRLDTILLRKLKIIAGYNGTTQAGIIEKLLEDYVKEYEQKHGKIKLPLGPDKGAERE